MKILKQIGRVIVRTAIRLYFIVVYRVKVEGTENIPRDKEQPLIYCGNQRNYADPPLIVVTAKRHVRFLAKEELRKNPTNPLNRPAAPSQRQPRPRACTFFMKK